MIKWFNIDDRCIDLAVSHRTDSVVRESFGSDLLDVLFDFGRSQNFYKADPLHSGIMFLDIQSVDIISPFPSCNRSSRDEQTSSASE